MHAQRIRIGPVTPCRRHASHVVLWERVVFLTWLGCLWLVCGCGAGPVARPLIQEHGAVLSELVFPPGEGTVTLPLERAGGLLVTDAVMVNGRHVGWMAIDTGASWTTLDRATAGRMGITNAPPWETLPGHVPPDGLYRVAALDVGQVGFRNHIVGVADLSSVSRIGRAVAGVVGGDVLGCLPFTLDYERSELTIYSRSKFEPPAGADEHRLFIRRPRTRGSFIAANPAAGQPHVTGRIDGTPARLLLDTASSDTLVLFPWFARELAHPPTDPDSRVVARAAGASGPLGLAGRELREATVDHVDALGARLRCDGTALVLSGEPNASDRRDDPSAAILGNRFLAHWRLTFDYARGRIWVEWSGRRAND